MNATTKWIGVLAGAGILIAAAAYFILVRPDSPTGATPASLERYRIGQIEMGIAVEPGTPRIGENRLVIELTDAEGNPVAGSAIDAYAEMPEMGAMPAMRAPADLREVTPGRYEGSMNLSMRGAWPLTVQIQGPDTGEEALVRFDLATDRPGLELAAGAEPASGGEAATDAAGGGGPASAGESASPADAGNAIAVDSRRRQLIGLETGQASYRRLVRPIRAVGRVAYDERLRSEIALRFDGYIDELEADYVGVPIAAGEILFTVYGPELLAAQQEYLEALRRSRGGGADSALLRAARQRLRLWNIAETEIEALERRGTPADYLPIRAPRSGTLIERRIADGSAARRGDVLLVIADLSRVWIEAEVFEADLELVREGTTAEVTLPYLPGRRFESEIEYVYPYVEHDTRTGRVRLTLDNPNGELRPNMYAAVSLQVDLGERLSVPEEAVIVAGDTRVVFVDLGDGRLNPVRVQTGRRVQGFVEVLAGLSAGDRVVTSGNFLIAAETRLRTGIEQW